MSISNAELLDALVMAMGGDSLSAAAVSDALKEAGCEAEGNRFLYLAGLRAAAVENYNSSADGMVDSRDSESFAVADAVHDIWADVLRDLGEPPPPSLVEIGKANGWDGRSLADALWSASLANADFNDRVADPDNLQQTMDAGRDETDTGSIRRILSRPQTSWVTGPY